MYTIKMIDFQTKRKTTLPVGESYEEAQQRYSHAKTYLLLRNGGFVQLFDELHKHYPLIAERVYY